MARPSDLPSSGSFCGPKSRSAMTRMRRISGVPTDPMRLLQRPGAEAPRPESLQVHGDEFEPERLEPLHDLGSDRRGKEASHLLQLDFQARRVPQEAHAALHEPVALEELLRFLDALELFDADGATF